MAVTYKQFFIEMLRAMGIQPNDQNLAALASVAHYEGLNQYYNPLNVVQPEPGSKPFNSVGVQMYPDAGTGIKGTTDLLKGPIWNPVRQALKSGSYDQILLAFDNVYRTWGSSGPVPVSANTYQAVLNDSLGNAIGNIPVENGGTDTKPSSGQSRQTKSNTNILTDIEHIFTSDPEDPIEPGKLLKDIEGFVNSNSNPVAGALSTFIKPAVAVGDLAQKVTWIFNIDHFIKFMLYLGGAISVAVGLGLILFGAGKNEGDS